VHFTFVIPICIFHRYIYTKMKLSKEHEKQEFTK
jgi:hypothetical protein